ncbi:MAG: hypothetical protein HY824_17300 [Acidobacteria bacterium]|nr:hypothetical protein [Acidobacteriota bacterium]
MPGAGSRFTRRRSDAPDFVRTDLDIAALSREMCARYAGVQPVVIDGTPGTATFFPSDDCPEFRVMRLAGALALAINQRAAAGRGRPAAIPPLRVTVEEVMLAALLHDLGKQHEDCAPFIELLRQTNLRADLGPDAAHRKEYLLGIVRDVHCRKGPCMIDRLRDAGRTELSNPFIVTVARRHGDDYEVNRCSQQGCWWSRDINVITLADDYDALTSEGPERAYRNVNASSEEAVAAIQEGVARGRYEARIAQIFLEDVLG